MIKKYCKKCIRGHGHVWSLHDERRWEEGRVWCVGMVDRVCIGVNFVKDGPPKWCCFALEHVVLGQEGVVGEKRAGNDDIVAEKGD